MRARALAPVLVASVIAWAEACGSADGALFGGNGQEGHPRGGAGGSLEGGLSESGGRGPGGRTSGSGGDVSTMDASTSRTCKNSLDCVGAPDGRQVCDRASGVCVECVARADCSATTQCYAGHCRSTCASDKDCTSQGLLCNPAAGHCVECQMRADCPARQVCVAGSCESAPPPGSGGAGSGGTGAGGHIAAGGIPAAGGMPATGGAGAGGTGAGGAPMSTCTDGTKNGTETDIDCGGMKCPPCPIGSRCAIGADCATGSCAGGTCGAAPASCTDKVKNGGETGVDCGGTCPPCDKGQPCRTDTDCLSMSCVGGTCAEATCSDGVRNGMETSVDCGGGCPCRVGSSCIRPMDCASANCVVSSSSGIGMCAPATTCSNSTRDGKETAPDCGGPACNKCAAGKACEGSADCASATCTNKICGACDPTKCPKAVLPSYVPCCTSAGVCGQGISTGTFCI
jgi:hypothetical protein